MSEHDIIFTAYNEERDIEYILYKGTPDTYGYEHIKSRRRYLADRIHIIKSGVEKQTIAIWNSAHGKAERIFCLGADIERPKLYVAIVVDYINHKKGKIITAWQTYDLCEGDITYVGPR